MKKALALFTLVMSFVTAQAADAGWTGPVEIISGGWGAGKGQFGIRSEGGFEVLPVIEAITNDDHVIVYDPVNKKQLVFDHKGVLANELKWDAMRGQGENALSALPHKDREARMVFVQRSGANTYQITAVFPDKNVVVIAKKVFSLAMRDQQGSVYGIFPEMVVRFDKSGRQTDVLNLPSAHEELIAIPGQPAPRGLYVLFGEPVVGPSGSVYLSKKTDTAFSILKWTWR
jgi:hypothetical protein